MKIKIKLPQKIPIYLWIPNFLIKTKIGVSLLGQIEFFKNLELAQKKAISEEIAKLAKSFKGLQIVSVITKDQEIVQITL